MKIHSTLRAVATAALLTVAFKAGAVSFNEDIRPLLADRCFACHGPDSAARKADLRLDREETAKAALGSAGVIPIIPGHPDQSAIIQRLTSFDPDEMMPPPESKLKVSEAEIALIRQWIKEGAKWQRHWAFIPPRKDPIPSVKDNAWPRNEVDRFILARLEAEGMSPSPAADQDRLLRRVTFDLTGLPPTLAELDAMDGSEGSYERAVDRLLNSPAFGERLALQWLDVARYGDTDGLFEDHPRSIYPWRDWVVSAFNDNLPFNDFIAWQIAGDLLPEATPLQKLATGFLRNNPTSNEGGIIDEDYRIKYLVDRVNTTSTAFLGLTMECAQCHDHKFDPMTQREYFQFGGFFNNLVGNGNTKGATDPTLRIFKADALARLAEIDRELAVIEMELKETSPALLSDFEQWITDLETPIDWQTPPVALPSKNSPVDPQKPSTPNPSEVRGQLVRISLPPGKTGFLTISEVEIFSQGSNVARSGEAKQSSVDYNSPAAKALNGNHDGTFASCSCTKEERDAWWEVDLGSVSPIDHVIIWNRNDCCPERLDEVTIDILDAERQIVAQHKLGQAVYKNLLTLNPNAPLPQSEPESFLATLSVDPGPLAALRLTGQQPIVIDSIQASILPPKDDKGAKPRTLKLVGQTGLKLKQEPVIIALENTEILKEGEKLRLQIVSPFPGDLLDIQVTGNQTAATRASLPQSREKRLEHFRGQWAGFKDRRQQQEALGKEKKGIEDGAPLSMIAADLPQPRMNRILLRGEYDKPGEEVPPAAPGSIMPYPGEYLKNRLGLARWMIDRDNPLTARVAVNRYWQMIFGTGLVRTSEDFGTQGERPSHQALLDHLAVDFVETGWDVKGLIRRMVLSATYRQSTAASPGRMERDPGNRLLSHAPRQRLAAEFIRDQALAVSGLLVHKPGGPGVHPYQPADLFGPNAIGASNASFKQSTGEGLYRRSLYTYWKRQIPAANMRILGADGRTACRTRREKTNTPLQALVLLNDPQFVEASRELAQRAMKEGGTQPQARLAFAFRLCTSRHATNPELEILMAEFNDRLKAFRADAESAQAYLGGGGDRKPGADLDPAELAAYAAVASLILNLDESISKS